MQHRIKNLFAMVAGLVLLTSKEATDVEGLVRDFYERLSALARAHALTLPDLTEGKTEDRKPGLKSLLAALVEHHKLVARSVMIEGDDLDIGAKALPTLALLNKRLQCGPKPSPAHFRAKTAKQTDASFRTNRRVSNAAPPRSLPSSQQCRVRAGLRPSAVDTFPTTRQLRYRNPGIPSRRGE